MSELLQGVLIYKNKKKMGSTIDQQCCKFNVYASLHEEILHQSQQMVVLEWALQWPDSQGHQV